MLKPHCNAISTIVRLVSDKSDFALLIRAFIWSSLNGILKGNGSTVQAATAGTDYMAPPATATALPSRGTALTANTLYNVSAAVGTYSFTAPATGWAHGIFTTGTTPNITFTGKIIGKLPTFEASKQYEFDVLDGAWVVQEVLTQ